RYDTMGVEAAWVADGLAKNLTLKREALGRLKALRLSDSPQRGSVGTIVGVGPDEGPVEMLYFILPACGGAELPSPEPEKVVRVVTPGANVGRELIGKELGDEVNVRPRRAQPDVVLMLS
ncbi:MAG: hypothetical protein KGN36_09665, partial [Acidobacteriota bacterium]|nr:hypothetical protein [Acidobacteriota bacterium]